MSFNGNLFKFYGENLKTEWNKAKSFPFICQSESTNTAYCWLDPYRYRFDKIDYQAKHKQSHTRLTNFDGKTYQFIFVYRAFKHFSLHSFSCKPSSSLNVKREDEVNWIVGSKRCILSMIWFWPNIKARYLGSITTSLSSTTKTKTITTTTTTIYQLLLTWFWK